MVSVFLGTGQYSADHFVIGGNSLFYILFYVAIIFPIRARINF